MARLARLLPARPRLALRRTRAAGEPDVHIPLDPRLVIGSALDPELERLRVGLRGHRRRLWIRRIVRRAWIAAAVLVAAELVLAVAARLAPIESSRAIGAVILLVVLFGLFVAAIRTRPSLGEAAIAVDREGQLGDRVASALALAAAMPAAAGPATAEEEALLDAPAAALDREAEERRFVRRQRRDALASLRLIRVDLFKPRLSRRPALASLLMTMALGAAVFLPNPQDAVIAQNRAIRQEAVAQAQKLDKLADQLAAKGTNPDDPRTRWPRSSKTWPSSCGPIPTTSTPTLPSSVPWRPPCDRS